MIGIKAIAPYITGQRVAAAALAEKGDLAGAELEYYNTVGIETVYVAEQHTGYQLARAAAQQLLDETGLEAETLDLIIYIKSRLPEYLVSSEATRLQHELGATNALTYSLSDLGCADMSMALKQAADFLKANPHAENVLICYGCKPASPLRYRYPVTINGDGGLALVVCRTGENQLLDIEIRADGRFWDLFRLEYQHRTFPEYREDLTNPRRYGFELAMESRNVFQELNEKVLLRNRLGREQIGHYLLQNLSQRAYAFYEMAFEIKISPVCAYNLARYGHLGPADVMLNYFTGVESGLFKKGDTVLVMNNSPVAVWSSILMRV
jgi:3-oxoacyl-[acyl-carrier-protein] synthase-3